jgi:hypothetical protein
MVARAAISGVGARAGAVIVLVGKAVANASKGSKIARVMIMLGVVVACRPGRRL